jgi:hypothetical protein
MKTYKYKQKQINYKGQKHKVKQLQVQSTQTRQLQSTTKPTEKTSIKHNKNTCKLKENN